MGGCTSTSTDSTSVTTMNADSKFVFETEVLVAIAPAVNACLPIICQQQPCLRQPFTVSVATADTIHKQYSVVSSNACNSVVRYNL